MATNTIVPPLIVVGEVETTNRQEGSVSNRKTGKTTRHIDSAGGRMALLCAGLLAKATGTSRATIRSVVLQTLAALVILTSVFSFAQVPIAPTAGQLEADAERAMKVETASFPERAALVERLNDARGRATGEPAARLALLWLRSVKWMLASIPLAQRDGEPHQEWIGQHPQLVVYSEPAGEWLIFPDVIWKLHDQYRDAAVAEEIAWLAVQNGLPGECEGYVPCYAQGMNTLDGEYLRRYPKGAHVALIVERVKGTLEQAIRLTSEPDGQQFLSPATDCGDLKEPLTALRTAVAASPASADRDQTVTLADEILQICR
jgi:hypothetical protein